MEAVTLEFIDWSILHEIDKLGEGTVSTIGEIPLHKLEKECEFPRSELHRRLTKLQDDGFVRSEKRVDPTSSEQVEVIFYSLTQEGHDLVIRQGKQTRLSL